MVDGHVLAYEGDIASDPAERVSVRLGALDRMLDKLVHTSTTWEQVIVLVGDAGMGKTRAARALLDMLEHDGVLTRYVSVGQAKDRDATTELRTVARGVRRSRAKDKRFAVVLDDMPATDECDLDAQLRCVKQLLAARTLVVMCVRPECVQLAEEIPDAQIIWPENLVIPCADIQAGAMQSATNGVPALVATYQAEAPASSWECDDARVGRRSAALVKAYVRETLPIEEQHLRLAMMLLGQGSFEDLSLIVDRCSPDALSWLAHDAPFFGIDLAGNVFRSAFLASLSGFRSCASAMTDAVLTHPLVALKSAMLLARRGEYGRSALVAACLESLTGAAELVREWGIEYLCAGEDVFVGRVLASEVWGRYYDDGPAAEVERAYNLLTGVADLSEPVVRNALELASVPDRVRLRWRHLELLQAIRDLDCGLATPRAEHERSDDDQLACELALHVRVRTLLLEGHVADAYQLLVNSPLKSGSDTLAELLLSDDFLIAQLLSGEGLDERETAHVMEVRERLAANPRGRLARYRPHLETLLLVLAGRLSHLDDVEQLISYADKMGDSALAAIFLLVAAIADNRSKAYMRAHVRALQASARISGAFGGLVGRQSRLIAGLAATMLDDEGELVSLASEPPDSIERDLAAYFCGERSLGRKPRPTVLLVSASSDNAAWALNMLCHDFGERSDEFKSAIPPSWSAASRRMVRKAEAFSRSMERALWRSGAPNHTLPSGPEGSDEQRARIEVFLLGELLVRVDGREVDVQQLEKRRARSLLVHLAARKGHRASRFELIESIWSEYGFDGGRQKLYEATYTMRSTFGIKRKTVNIFSATRGKATIGLNSDLFSFDVDAFEQKAKEALAQNASEERVIALVCDAMDLYRGDLCPDTYDALSMVEARRSELRSLFVDLAITGARAALKEGRLSLATRIACRGYEVSPTREDVVLVYVEALKATGRYHDAREVYQHYSYAVVEATGMPPTRALREAASDLLPAPRARKTQRKATNMTVE